jgi:GH15 family glucan-1,4-alpha-glucosidase
VQALRAIGDHAIIGNGRTTALIARDGAIDWLCWPRPDSPPLFGAILDERAGLWRLRPAPPHRASWRYLPGTNVLETTFEAPDGAVRLTDLMPVGGGAEEQILRRVEGLRGALELEQVFEPRLDWGRETPRREQRGALGVFVPVGRGVVVLRSPVGTAARFVVRAGERRDFTLTWACEGPAWLGVGDLDATVAWWRAFASGVRAGGRFRDHVVRGALCLKLLVHAPSAAILAAPTSSLPERLGGALNWDYRYCWLRDASFTVRALHGVGMAEEARAFASWLVHATALTRPELRVLYDVYGERPPRERELPHLAGHGGSRPVRAGNGASEQLQLDVYGEVVDAIAQLARHGARIDRETRRLLAGYGEVIRRRWREPDHGIWERRGPRRRYTHSALLSWVALDRLGLADDAARVRRAIEEQAWNERLGAYAGWLGGDELDAAVLLAASLGYERAGAPRPWRTWCAIRDRLGAGPGLFYRYRPVEPEGAFAAVSFWAVEHLARAGALDEADALMDAIVGRATDLGLFAEEIDPATGEHLGNFPQTFSHVGAICAALTLEEERSARDERRKLGPVELRGDAGADLHPGG